MMLTKTSDKKRMSDLPRAFAPKFVDNEELHGRATYERLFAPTADTPKTAGAGHQDEVLRFKRMHFCARRMKALGKRFGAAAEKRPDYERFASLHKQLRDQIASDNLGLVYDLYKRSRILNVDGDELLSEGMMALTRAIYTFDPWRGFRFSTYACNAIVRAFYRCGLKESKRRQREPLNFEQDYEKSDWHETCRGEERNLYAERLSRILTDGSVELTPIEREVLEQRFPLKVGAERRTLSSIGRTMSLSKERVRQIQNSAIGKLREALELDPVLR